MTDTEIDIVGRKEARVHMVSDPPLSLKIG